MIAFSFAVLMMATLASTGALAQQAAGDSDTWQFGVSIYGWFPDIAGQTAFTQPGGGDDFEIDIDNILDNLKFTLMGTLDVRKGRWGLLTDFLYMDRSEIRKPVRVRPASAGLGLPVNAD